MNSAAAAITIADDSKGNPAGDFAMTRPLCALLLVAVFAAEAAAAPNLILFVTDDMGADAGCYGNPVIQTPNLDALAKGGIRMTHAFCTTASCSASRSVILTGLYNHANAQFGHEHSYHHFRTYDSVKSLPVLLSAAGYRTARIGKLHVGPPEVYKFDHALPGNARSPVEMAENCRELIAAQSDKPFFLYFCTADPHRGGGKIGTPLPVGEGGLRSKPGEGAPGKAKAKAKIKAKAPSTLTPALSH